MKQFYVSLLSLALLQPVSQLNAQYAVSEIVTDFGGYWKSAASAQNNTKPNNSHNLLSFSFNNQRYSTGVNDAVLSSHALSFVPGNYQALPMQSITGTVNSNTKIGLGELYDGVSNGSSNPRPENNIPKYLTDGINGLDIGTCVANLPAGKMYFPVGQLFAAAINDGVPDLLITQTADPASSGLDRYEFIDFDGNRIGNAVDIVLNNIPSVGQWTADFYEASTNPMQLSGGFTKTDRAIRLWAADFSAFGINAGNINQIAYFRITLNGNSDVAFVAYNDKALSIQQSVLPIKLESFAIQENNTGLIANWQTRTEINSRQFVLEGSEDGVRFTALDSVRAAGNSQTRRNYSRTSFRLSKTMRFFRLRMDDQDGSAQYSTIRVLEPGKEKTALGLYPNPATAFTTLKHSAANLPATITLFTNQGMLLQTIRVSAGATETRLDLSRVAPGSFQVRYSSSAGSAIVTAIKL